MRPLILSLLLLTTLPVYAATTKIEVLVTGIKNNNGQVILALHNDADSFPTKPKQAIRTLNAKIQNGQASVVFDNINPGVYAIAVYHDENSNNILDSNFLGIPKEGVGVSNEVKGHFGPPKFSDAKFRLEENLSLKIGLNY